MATTTQAGAGGAPPPKTQSDDYQLSRLFDYTKFHIGLYTTLITGLFGVVSFAVARASGTPGNTIAAGDVRVLAHLLPYMKWSAFFTLCAGVCAGVVASSIPDHTSYGVFKDQDIKVFSNREIDGLTYEHVIHGEHIFFWIAVTVAAIGFLSLRLQ